MSEELTRAGTAREAARRERSRADAERSLEQLSRWMDGLFRVPGTGWRFGLDALVGLIPGAGDLATTAVSIYILASGVRYRVPKVTLLRMAANVAVDYLLGSVPFVGDLFDAFWKSNQMNVELLRKRATVAPGEEAKARAGDWLFLALIVVVLLALLVGSLAVAFWILSWPFGGIPSPFEMFR